MPTPPATSVRSHVVPLLFIVATLVPAAATAIGLGFVENRGQYDDQARFFGQTSDVTVWVMSDGTLRLFVAHGAGDVALRPGLDVVSRRRQIEAATVRVDEIHDPVVIEGVGRLQAQHNVYLGDDPAAWVAAAPCYKTVSMKSVSGADVSLSLSDESIRLDFAGTPGQVSLVATDSSRGVRSLRTEHGEFRVIQNADGNSEIRYASATSTGVHRREGRIGQLAWGTFAGGSSFDEFRAIEVTAGQEVILVGKTASQNFPTSVSGSLVESEDIVVAKFSSNGARLIWSTVVGGEDVDSCWDVVLDSRGDILVSGATHGTGFPTTPGVFSREFSGGRDCTVFKLDAATGLLIWSTMVGGAVRDEAVSLAVDSQDRPIVGGLSYSSDFPVTLNAFDTTHGGGADAVVFALSPDGTDLEWSTFLGGSQVEFAEATVVDDLDRPIVSGFALSSTFPTTSSAYDPSFNGDWDVFVTAVEVDGSDLAWSTFVGGDRVDIAYGLERMSNGDLVICGRTESLDFPTTFGAYDESYNGGVYPEGDAFVARLTGQGDALMWCTYMGGVADDVALNITELPNQDVVAVGLTRSIAYPSTDDALDVDWNGGADGFLSVIDGAAGATLSYSTFVGGSGEDLLQDVAWDYLGNPIFCGRSSSGTYPVTPGAFDTSYNGGTADAVVSKLDLFGVVGTAPVPPPRGLFLAQNRPNPFRSRTELRFWLEATDQTRVEVFDVTGRFVSRLYDAIALEGWTVVNWDGRTRDGRNVAAGVYYCRLTVGDLRLTRSMVVGE